MPQLTRAGAMRLTLRTLLAYIDGILSPEDHEELAQRIEASDNARELLHRAGDTVRRIRLGAPPVESDTHDANAVAEYLDGSMPPDEVVQFERRCFESDPELAEAASCHHILTMVLGQRADVDEDSRRALYGLPAQHAANQRPEPVVVRAVEEPATAADAEVPDYLRAAERSLVSRLAPAIAAVVVLAAASWFLLPGGGYDKLANPDEMAANGGDSQEQGIAGPPDASLGGVPDGDAGAADGAAAAQPPLAPPGASAAEPPTPEASDPPGATATPDATAPGSADDLPGEPAGPLAALPDAPPAGVGLPAGPDSTEPVPTELFPAEPTPLDPLAAGDGGDSGLPLAAAADEGLPLSADPGGAAEAESPPKPPEPREIGLVSSAGEVLLLHDGESDTWSRVPRLTDIKTGDKLLALPTYRPTLDTAGLRLDLVGGVMIAVEQDDQDPERSRIRLIYGRVLITNTGDDGATLALAIDDLEAVATLNRGAVLAIEADRPFQAGVDPMTKANRLVGAFHAPEGGVQWEDAAAGFAVDDGATWRLVEGRVGETKAYEQVDWVEGRPLSPIEAAATADFERKLEPGEPIWPQLAALSKSRRLEERALAAISSVHVAHFDPFIAALRDGDQKAAWEQEIEALRSAMSRSPEHAAVVQQTLVESRGEQYAADLYRMLCGFNDEQIGLDGDQRRAGALRDLIDWLDSDQLDYRVLANHNLEQITGRRGVFNPVGPLRSRKTGVARYRSRLEDDALLPRGSR